jgi:hypothetical protein
MLMKHSFYEATMGAYFNIYGLGIKLYLKKRKDQTQRTVCNLVVYFVVYV